MFIKTAFLKILRGLSNINDNYTPKIRTFSSLEDLTEHHTNEDINEDNEDIIIFEKSSSIEDVVKIQWLSKSSIICWDLIQHLIRNITSPSKNLSILFSDASPLKKLNQKDVEKLVVINHQRKLLQILFSTIQYVPLKSLSNLLQSVKNLMLIPVNENENPFGLPLNETGRLWKELFEVVSAPDAIDYLRRKACVKWYLDLVHEAKSIDVKKIPEEPVEFNNDQLEKDIKLKAKL